MISIRPIDFNDTHKIVEWRNNPIVRKNFIFQQQLTDEMHINWMETQVLARKCYQFIIVDEDLNADVGSVFLRDVDMSNKKAEFGIFIGDDLSRGKGIGTNATKQILKFAFEELELNKVFLRVFASNLGAIKSYEKAGFKKEGLFYQDVIINGTSEDLVFMAILKKEWINL